jgi:hypothetical protein
MHGSSIRKALASTLVWLILVSPLYATCGGGGGGVFERYHQDPEFIALTSFADSDAASFHMNKESR